MQQPTKQEFTVKVRLWLNHKRVMSSKSEHYKKPQVIISLGKVHDLVKMVRKDCTNFTMPQICQLIRIHQEHLYNILPNMNNRSYKGELEKLNMIITIANSYKK